LLDRGRDRAGHVDQSLIHPDRRVDDEPVQGRQQVAYRVEIEGSPSIRCELELAENHDHDLGARMAGASRMVNAISAVAAAAPGLLSALDLPLITGVGLLKPAPGP
jgi:4-hydroxy-tetrahydrodipicolinate reductase